MGSCNWKLSISAVLVFAIAVDGQQGAPLPPATVVTPPRGQPTPNAVDGRPLAGPQFANTSPKPLPDRNNLGPRQEPPVAGRQIVRVGPANAERTPFGQKQVPTNTKPGLIEPPARYPFGLRVAGTQTVVATQKPTKFGTTITTSRPANVNQFGPNPPKTDGPQTTSPLLAKLATPSPVTLAPSAFQQPGNPTRTKRGTRRAQEINLRMREMEYEDGEGPSKKERQRQKATGLLVRLLDTIDELNGQKETTAAIPSAAPMAAMARMCPRIPGAICNCRPASRTCGPACGCGPRPNQPSIICMPRNNVVYPGLRLPGPGCCPPRPAVQLAIGPPRALAGPMCCPRPGPNQQSIYYPPSRPNQGQIICCPGPRPGQTVCCQRPRPNQPICCQPRPIPLGVVHPGRPACNCGQRAQLGAINGFQPPTITSRCSCCGMPLQQLAAMAVPPTVISSTAVTSTTLQPTTTTEEARSTEEEEEEEERLLTDDDAESADSKAMSEEEPATTKQPMIPHVVINFQQIAKHQAESSEEVSTTTERQKMTTPAEEEEEEHPASSVMTSEEVVVVTKEPATPSVKQGRTTVPTKSTPARQTSEQQQEEEEELSTQAVTTRGRKTSMETDAHEAEEQS